MSIMYVCAHKLMSSDESHCHDFVTYLTAAHQCLLSEPNMFPLDIVLAY